METRKVQRLGPSTLAMTLPAEWVRSHEVAKGDEVSLRTGNSGTLTVMTDSVNEEDTEAIVHAEGLDADATERAIVAQYVLGRRVIRVTSDNGVLDSDIINAVYRAENKLMGLGVIEETPESMAIRCSVDAEDFRLDNLLQRLESTGNTMRGEAIKALAHGNPDLAERALNRERQANKIFVLMLRLIFTAHQNPNLAPAIGLESDFPLIGYRAIAKNLELVADKAEDIAEIVLDTGKTVLEIDQQTIRRIRDFADEVDELSSLTIDSVVERNYDLTVESRDKYYALQDREIEILKDLPEMSNYKLLKAREVLVSLRQTAEYSMRNSEIAANLALNTDSEYITIK
ncbi:phosphate uptake regulator PhoU [Salinarchaeum sp. IM2453]|uniref:phosphate signaling complex PhoU family protein n=1 Tax=Salinarchaeum sp. IM2453 TaxID=2862870 RepID=UPI001C839396|nr:phosphate uptake regulator PhoU [Salinarchaeum sp. IM2453]QZA88944.1 phosphate uptake regulator PhoU [Salinarchaeum sp. IM2453]